MRPDPRSLAEYTGPANQEFDVRNATAAVDSHFNLAIHENYGAEEARGARRRQWGYDMEQSGYRSCTITTGLEGV